MAGSRQGYDPEGNWAHTVSWSAGWPIASQQHHRLLHWRPFPQLQMVVPSFPSRGDTHFLHHNGGGHVLLPHLQD